MDRADRTPICVADYERLAHERLDAGALAYLTGGAADEISQRWNREAFDRIALVPRVLRGGAGSNTRLELLDRSYAHPIFIAPTAHQKLAHPHGEVGTAVAAEAQGACMVLSCQASTAMEDVVAAGATCRWFQLYLQPSREATVQLVRRAEAAGFEVLVATVDAPVNGVRNREQREGFAIPAEVAARNLAGLPSPEPYHLPEGASLVFDHFMRIAPTWEDIDWLKTITALPIVVKGILAPQDAVLAADIGVSGVVVSNHGGRTLDTALATIDALPAISAAVAGRVPLLLDGGVRRGTDVLKALALGASAVMVGRPVVCGLAVAGTLGVSHVLRLLRDEFEIAMALTGCRSLDDITSELVVTRAR